jgi:hypothetical protein
MTGRRLGAAGFAAFVAFWIARALFKWILDIDGTAYIALAAAFAIVGAANRRRRRARGGAQILTPAERVTGDPSRATPRPYPCWCVSTPVVISKGGTRLSTLRLSKPSGCPARMSCTSERPTVPQSG